MRKLFLFVAILLLTQRASATFTTSQHRSATGCSGTSCTVTGFTAIAAGSMVVGIGFGDTSIVPSAGSSNAGTWTVPSGCSATSNCLSTNTSAGGVLLEYILSSTGSPTSVIVTSSAGNFTAVEVLVFTFTSGPVSFDSGGTANRTTNCTTCAGITTTVTGNDLIVQAITCAQTCATSGTAGFVGASPYVTTSGGVNDFPAGDGVGAAINQSSGTAPNWAQSPTGNAAVTAIAFKESSGTVKTMPPVVY